MNKQGSTGRCNGLQQKSKSINNPLLGIDLMMNFETWFDVEGTHFDTAHFSDSLALYSFKDGGCYLLQGKVQVDFNLPTINIEKMARLPFIPDSRYEDDKDLMNKTQGMLKNDVSYTHRAPYPGSGEIGLPRHKMKS